MKISERYQDSKEVKNLKNYIYLYNYRGRSEFKDALYETKSF